FNKLEDFVATFSIDKSQPIGTLGPNHEKLWGFKLRGNSILRGDPLNEPMMYTEWDQSYETKGVRIYVFDSKTDEDHPFINAFFVTNGLLKTPTDVGEEESNGLWSWVLSGKKNKLPKARLYGKCVKKQTINGDSTTSCLLESVTVKVSMIMVAIEEQRKDKFVDGVKYLIVDGGQQFLRRRKGCAIS
ncbi:2800_t:CDS:1, partial [Dentiscutata erythropus]